MSDAWRYRCGCGHLYPEHRGPMGCPRCGSKQEFPARIDGTPPAPEDVDLRDFPVVRDRNPKDPGRYVCWMPGAFFPVVLPWSGHEQCWRRGAQRVSVTAWLGPLPEVHP